MKHINLPLLCTLVLLCACARQPAMETPSPEARAHLEQTWQRYAAADAAVAPAPYRLQLSLRFGTEGDTRRVTAPVLGQRPAQTAHGRYGRRGRHGGQHS